MPFIGIAVALAAALTLPLTFASRLPPLTQQQVVVIFNLGIPCLALLWMLVPGGRQPGAAAAVQTYHFVALVSFILHITAVLQLLLAYEPDLLASWNALAAVAAKRSVDVMPANFMMFDFLGVLGTAVLFTVVEGGGLVGAAGLLASGLLVGFGPAFALVLAQREERLAGAVPAVGAGGAGSGKAAAAGGVKRD